MNLVDSSGWLEYFAGTQFAKVFSKAIEDTDNLIISSINFYEVYKKVLIEKDEHHAIEAVAIMQLARVIDVDVVISINAARISYDYKIPMADSLIYSTAQLHNATLWTLDSDFEELPGVKFFRKQ